MKKTYLAGLVALAFAGNAMAVEVGDDETGVINFAGTIVAGACDVTINVDGAGTTNATNLVTLGAVSTSDFLVSDAATDAGAITTGSQDFSVDFSNCADVDNESFELALIGDFTGNQGVVNAIYDGAAENAVTTLGFQIKDASANPANAGVVDWTTANLTGSYVNTDDTTFSFPLNVAYYQTTDATPPTAGIARASVNYLVSYQ